MSFITQIEQDVVSIFKKADSIEASIAAFATKLINGLKEAQANPTVDFIETTAIQLAETEYPALKPLITGIETYLPKIISLVSQGVVVLDSGAEATVNTLATYLESVKGIDGTIYATILAGLNAGVQKFLNNNANLTATSSQLIVASQAAYVAAK